MDVEALDALLPAAQLVHLRLLEWVELHVLDHGSGFADDYLPHAFERFSRPTGSRSGGAGLGLALVEAVARAHGGQAGAANAEPGADVWLTLRRAS